MNLQLPLKGNWFEMTKKGIKTEDYREITPYWCNRLLVYDGVETSVGYYNFLLENEGDEFVNIIKLSFNLLLMPKKINTNTMTLGYPKSGDIERILKLEHKGIEVRTGNPEWGAEPNKLYFVIKHGSIIQP